MILSKLNFIEHKSENNYWEIKNLNFNMINLVVGLNATGKTRLVNIISNLAKIISKKRMNLLDGNWLLEFKKTNNTTYKYELEVKNKKVKFEQIKVGKIVVLKRENNFGKIYSHKFKTKIEIHPPADELTLHVRRDVKEFPFLEDLFLWANNFLGYRFTGARPDLVIVPISTEQKDYLEDLGATPYLLKKAINDKNFVNAIIKDFSSIGYPIDKVKVKSTIATGIPNDILISIVKEKDLKCETDQTKMSQGMYRAFSLIIIVEYLLRLKKDCTVVIDDLGEGLDFERSSKLTKIIIDKIKNSTIQLIMTSNDRFLINSVDIKYLNLLERNGHLVESFNVKNSRKLFEDFKYTGLNNFDLFSGKMYKSNE
ncbi:MAG: ATP-binding protein [Candidatus Cloacimonetes bacterium]|nr:ATP-binding protein [Candidatus Cloacimonadota bacterium]